MRLTELLIATGNPGKLREIRALLTDLPFRLMSPNDFPSITDVAETGSTYAENASLKALGYAKHSGVLTLADDSGLEVEILGGAPGVLSARYLGADTPYQDRVRALLAALKQSHGEERSARFVCSVVVASGAGEILHANQAICKGKIADASAGSGGFGYDPIFIPEGFDLTFAELPSEIKNEISHRGRALAEARQFLVSLTTTSGAR